MAARCHGVKVLAGKPVKKVADCTFQRCSQLYFSTHMRFCTLMFPIKKQRLFLHFIEHDGPCDFFWQTEIITEIMLCQFQILMLTRLGASVSFLLEATCHVISCTAREHHAVSTSQNGKALEDEKLWDEERSQGAQRYHVSEEAILEMHLVVQLPQMTSRGPELTSNLPTTIFPSSWHTKLWAK